jgi:hypothetical protein
MSHATRLKIIRGEMMRLITIFLANGLWRLSP